jgi:hypothetical protein
MPTRVSLAGRSLAIHQAPPSHRWHHPPTLPPTHPACCLLPPPKRAGGRPPGGGGRPASRAHRHQGKVLLRQEERPGWQRRLTSWKRFFSGGWAGKPGSRASRPAGQAGQPAAPAQPQVHHPRKPGQRSNRTYWRRTAVPPNIPHTQSTIIRLLPPQAAEALAPASTPLPPAALKCAPGKALPADTRAPVTMRVLAV